jgi:hypothetical protein
MAKAMQTTIVLDARDLAILEAIQQAQGLFSRAEAMRFALHKYAELAGLPAPKKLR